MAFNIGAIISVSGEREYNQAMNSIRQNLKYVTSEMKLVTSEFKTNEKSVEALTRQDDVFKKVLAEQEKAVSESRAALERLKNSGVDPTSKAYKSLEANLNYAQAAVYDTTNEIKANQKALEDAKAGTQEFSDTQEKGRGVAQKYLGGLTDIADALGIKIPSEITEAIGGFGDLDAKTAGSKSASGDAINGIVGSLGLIGPAAGIAAGAIAAIGTEAFNAWLEVDKLGTKLQISLGLTDEEAKNAQKGIERVYATGIGENRESAEQALAAVMRVMNVTGKEAEKYAERLQLINSVWGEDYATTANAASALMKEFGDTGQEALDGITASLQTSANKQGDLLETIIEYSHNYKSLGDTAELFLSRIVAGTDAGAQSADKAADAYKEFFSRAAGEDASFVKGLEDLRLSSEQIISMVLSGGDRAQQALGIVVGRLDGVRNEADRARISAELFGTKMEDVSTPAILAMGKVKVAIIDMKNASNNAMDEMTESAQVKWDRFWRSFWRNLTNIKNPSAFNEYQATIPQYATGTLNHPGGFAIVGERGPELVKLQRGAQVIPAQDTMRMLVPGGSPVGGAQIGELHIHPNAQQWDELMQLLKHAKSAQQQRRAGGR